MAIFKLIDNLKFYYNYLVSGFSSGGSWKVNRVTELTSAETRRIMIRNMSTYEELFHSRERVSHQ